MKTLQWIAGRLTMYWARLEVFIGDRVYSTKFQMFIMACVALWCDKLSGTEWLGAAGIYTAGNAADKWIDAKTKPPSE